jgi:hypothetical protein
MVSNASGRTSATGVSTNLGDLAFGPADKPGELDLGQAQALVVGDPLAS